jgi:hypothetical protein
MSAQQVLNSTGQSIDVIRQIIDDVKPQKKVVKSKWLKCSECGLKIRAEGSNEEERIENHCKGTHHLNRRKK